MLVGPNNSGKSLALREIEQWCRGRDELASVIREITVDFPDSIDQVIELVGPLRGAPPPNSGLGPDDLWIRQPDLRDPATPLSGQIRIDQFRRSLQRCPDSVLRHGLLRFFTARLDGRTRFALADVKESINLLGPPKNYLQALFQNDEARHRVMSLTADAFGRYFTIDPTAMTQLRIRMSSRPPDDSAEEQALDDRARSYHRVAPLLTELSDGVQAFVGLVSAVIGLPHRIMLIDEPEAFLHPPLARRLGADLSLLARERGASLVVATHSADFLRGCLESGVETTVVRLTFVAGIATARVLDAATLTSLIRHPLIRSTQAWNALFHGGAVITEGDTDRAFYDEINRRLVEEQRGIADALFLNAQNKQTVSLLVEPLRKIGIPAAAIVDLDVVNLDTTSWERLMRAC